MNVFSYFSTIIFVKGKQKYSLNGMVLLRIKNMLKLMSLNIIIILCSENLLII